MLIGNGGKLVGSGVGDGADEVFEIVSIGDEIGGEAFQQFGMGGGVCDAEIVFGFHEATTEEVFPVTIDKHSGEEGIVGIDHPVGEVFAGILVGGNGEFFPSKVSRFESFTGTGISRSGLAAVVKNNLFSGLQAGFTSDS